MTKITTLLETTCYVALLIGLTETVPQQYRHLARGYTYAIRGQTDRALGVPIDRGQGSRVRGPNVHQRQTTNKSMRQTTSSNTSQLPVVFPGELRPRLNDYGLPNCAMTSGVNGRKRRPEASYCDEDETYPTEIVKSVLQKVNVDLSDKTLLGRQPLNHEESIDQRVCATKRKTIYPKTAKNSDSEWLYVINDVEYAQAVTTEICAQEDSPCEFVASALPPGYTSACKQKFANRKLLAMHPTERKAYADNFPFPSCCVCYVRAPLIGGRSSRGRNGRR
ncbi:uncharacterized protein LOC135367854 [Ornithodoros turicata]